LEAVQTVVKGDADSTLTEIYANIIASRKEQLLFLSNIVVADAWFSKKPFADAMTAGGSVSISRLRDGANLKYLYSGDPTGKPGRPEKHDGKVNTKNTDKKFFEQVQTGDGTIFHTAIVYSVSLERNIRTVRMQ